MCKPKKLKRHLPASALEIKDRINASPSREGRITLPLNILCFPRSNPRTKRSSEPMVSQNANGGRTRPGYSRRLGLQMRGPARWRLARVGAVTKPTVRLGVGVVGLLCFRRDWQVRFWQDTDGSTLAPLPCGAFVWARALSQAGTRLHALFSLIASPPCIAQPARVSSRCGLASGRI